MLLEGGCNLVKSLSSSFRHPEEGEDEEEEEECGKYQEDVGPTEVLRRKAGRFRPWFVAAFLFKTSQLLYFILTATYWKPMPIMKLAVQLEQPATAMAAGLGPCEKSSATKNQGMGPGPTSKKATKPKMASMLM